MCWSTPFGILAYLDLTFSQPSTWSSGSLWRWLGTLMRLVVMPAPLEKRNLRGRDGRLEATTPIAWSTLDDNWCRFALVRYSIPNPCYLDQDLNDHQRLPLQKRQLPYD